MTFSGKLIVIEGIDGSGKRTQIGLLEGTLAARGHLVYSTGFPQYESWFGKMIGKFLNGQLGALEQVDPHFSAMLYAGDRFESKARLVAALELGKIVLADRYIASNLAHQTARAPVDKRAEFTAWIEHLEYTIYGLPKEDLVVHLRVPPREAQTLIQRKAVRTYTTAKQDLQESSLRHLEDAAAMYDLLSRRASWTTIECFSESQHRMRPPEEIAAAVLASVEPLLGAAAPRQAGKDSH
jgi:dTMP kinase